VSEAQDEPPLGRVPDGARARRNPWWIPPFLGRVPEKVEPKYVRLMGAVSLAVFFENFDQAMLTQAVKQIAEDFAIAESELGNLLGWVRLGAVPALLLIPVADRIGRRRVFLGSIVGMSLATALAAIATSAEVFVGLQMLARMFMVTSTATAFVIVTEELAAEHRGWGIGIIGAVGAFGVGLSALLFAAIDWLPYGWRAMYVLGVIPLLLMPMLRRRVTETARFRDQEREPLEGGAAAFAAGWLKPVSSLVRAYPARTLGVALIGAAQSGGAAVAYNFSAFFVQSVHGWAPGHYSLMLLAAGSFGVVGYPLAGRMADTRGRRVVGFVLFTALPVLALGFYAAPGWALPVLWVPMVFALTGSSTIVRALSTELFPTSFRGTASGWVQLVETLGAAAMLFLVSALTAPGESVIPAVRILVFVSLLGAVTLLALPETGRRELEDVSAERSGS
jgi:MFS family permease